jgi:hypothetical protein
MTGDTTNTLVKIIIHKLEGKFHCAVTVKSGSTEFQAENTDTLAKLVTHEIKRWCKN